MHFALTDDETTSIRHLIDRGTPYEDVEYEVADMLESRLIEDTDLDLTEANLNAIWRTARNITTRLMGE